MISELWRCRNINDKLTDSNSFKTYFRFEFLSIVLPAASVDFDAQKLMSVINSDFAKNKSTNNIFSKTINL